MTHSTPLHSNPLHSTHTLSSISKTSQVKPPTITWQSSLSVTPPCPGIRFEKSFTPQLRLKTLAANPPKGPWEEMKMKIKGVSVGVLCVSGDGSIKVSCVSLFQKIAPHSHSQYSSFIIHHSSFIIHHSSFIIIFTTYNDRGKDCHPEEYILLPKKVT